MKYILISNDFYKIEELSTNPEVEFFAIYGNRFSKSMNDSGYLSSDYFLIIGEEDVMMYTKMKDSSLRVLEIKDDDCYHMVKQYIFYISNLSDTVRSKSYDRINDCVLLSDLNRYHYERNLTSDYNFSYKFEELRSETFRIVEFYNQQENEILCFEVNLLNLLN